MIQFEVPGLPIPSPRPRVYANGGVDKGKRAAAYRGEVQAAFIAALVGFPLPRWEGPVRLRLWLHVGGRGDADNFAKNIMDALTGLAYLDDRQVEMLGVTLDRTRGKKYATIEVERL